MQLRWDINEGRLETLDALSDRWLNRQIDLGDEYEAQYAFDKVRWAPDTIAGAYFKSFFEKSYRDGARIAREYSVISAPLREWKYSVDKENHAEAQGWNQSDFTDAEWKTTDVGVETWSDLGLLDYMGTLWYRRSIDIPAVPEGKKVFLWIPSEDGELQVWVNGRPVPLQTTQADAPHKFSGYAQPISFDITGAVRPGAANQITVRATRTILNELGTGGLLMPLYMYREK
jgi:hypothetical protein